MEEEKQETQENTSPESGKKGGLNAHFKKHWYLYAAGFGGAVLILSFLNYKKTDTAQSGGNTSGLANGYSGHVDSMGGGYPDTSSYDSLASMLSGLNTAEAQNYSILSQLAKGQTATVSGPETSDPSTTNPISSWVGTIRARFSNGLTNSYDQNFSQGIPIRDKPDSSGKVIGYEAYGSQVSFVGSPVSGGNNFGATNKSGSSLWEKTTSGGYVSMYDIRGGQ